MSADTPSHPQGVSEALQDLVLIRRADADDAPFVFSYWLRDHFEHSAFARGVTKDTYMRLHHMVVERVIARSVMYVACDAEDPTVCYGFICVEGPTLHYLFVKRRFRGLGIARRLLSEAGLYAAGPKLFTHLTDTMIQLRKRWPLAEYSPYHV